MLTLEPKTVTVTVLGSFEFHRIRMLLHKRFLPIVRAHDGFKNNPIDSICICLRYLKVQLMSFLMSTRTARDAILEVDYD